MTTPDFLSRRLPDVTTCPPGVYSLPGDDGPLVGKTEAGTWCLVRKVRRDDGWMIFEPGEPIPTPEQVCDAHDDDVDEWLER